MKHRIYQVDGMNDEEESTEDSKIVTVDKINPLCPLGSDHHLSFSSQAEEFTFWKKQAANIEAEMKRLNYSVPWKFIHLYWLLYCITALLLNSLIALLLYCINTTSSF